MLGASDRVAGVRVARRVASVVLRVRARSAAGWLEGVHRVATRPDPGAPARTRLPARWWTTAPPRGVLAVANEVYRPAATTRPPAASTG